jgi:hypothetical protein
VKTRARVERLEKILKAEEKPASPIFIWFDDFGNLKIEERERAVAFRWEGEEKGGGPKGPTGKLSPELQARIDEIYSCPDPPQENALQRVETEISKTVDQLKKAGVSEKEIHKAIEKPEPEEDEGEKDHLCRLIGGRKGKRYSVDEG